MASEQWKKIGGRRHDDSSSPTTSPATSEPQNYELQSGRLYRCVGGPEDQLVICCPGCQAPYKGHAQQACEHCSQARKVFMLDVTDSPAPLVPPDQSVEGYAGPLTLPRFGGGDTRLGSSGFYQRGLTTKETAFGDEVILWGKGNITRVGANEVYLYDASLTADIVVAETVVAVSSGGRNYSLDCQNLIVTNFKQDGSGDITVNVGTAMIMDDGKVRFPDKTTIKHLWVGNHVSKIAFGRGCHIDKVSYVGHPSFSAGENLTIIDEEAINPAQFHRAAQNIFSQLHF